MASSIITVTASSVIPKLTALMASLMKLKAFSAEVLCLSVASIPCDESRFEVPTISATLLSTEASMTLAAATSRISRKSVTVQ